MKSSNEKGEALEAMARGSLLLLLSPTALLLFTAAGLRRWQSLRCEYMASCRYAYIRNHLLTYLNDESATQQKHVGIGTQS